MPGRPKVNRRKDASEKGATHTVSKVGKIFLCSVCKQAGHNKVTCSQAEKPTKFKVKKRKRAYCNVGEGSSGKKAKDVTDEQGSKGNKGINGNVGEGSSGKKSMDVTDEQEPRECFELSVNVCCYVFNVVMY
ncbi:unnamed protein product [Lactuca virosa]|uniref:Uncharacterized protein n=1 Tax=Lactuca virosa TaxID=75947 RepID=A0AAU9P680_9ASTR|nr:unnamed protein product [Lactuca virosa]